MDGVRALGLGDDVDRPDVVEATPEELARVHDAAYLARLEAFCADGGGDVDPDTYARADSWTAARAAPRAPAWLPSTGSNSWATESRSWPCDRPDTTPRRTEPWGSAC